MSLIRNTPKSEQIPAYELQPIGDLGLDKNDLGRHDEAKRIVEKTVEQLDVENTPLIARDMSWDIVFIDGAVDKIGKILRQLDPSVEIHVLDLKSDGVNQILKILAECESVRAIHIFATGENGIMNLGSGSVSAESVSTIHAPALKTIGFSLREGADIFIYGCDFASGDEGRAVAGQLSDLTGAEVKSNINFADPNNAELDNAQTDAKEDPLVTYIPTSEFEEAPVTMGEKSALSEGGPVAAVESETMHNYPESVTVMVPTKLLMLDTQGLTGHSVRQAFDSQFREIETHADMTLGLLMVDTYVSKNVLFIDINNSFDAEDQGLVSGYSIEQADGSDTPEWMRLVRNGFISIEQPKPVGDLELVISAQFENGKLAACLLRIDGETGKIQPLQRTSETDLSKSEVQSADYFSDEQQNSPLVAVTPA